MTKTNYWKLQISRSAVLSPVDRISEVLFGLIMVLTFTGAISVGLEGREEIRDLLVAALGCNIAWGIVDAIMYLMNVIFERGHSRKILQQLRKTPQGPETEALIIDELPTIIGSVMDKGQITALDRKLRELPEPPAGMMILSKDLLSAFYIFLLVFLCTLPVVIPFVVISEPQTALRLSNGIALLMLAAGGYRLAKSSGLRPVITAIVYMLIGVALVAATMALGG